MTTYELISLIIQAFAAIATLSAVLVSLHLAYKRDEIKVKIHKKILSSGNEIFLYATNKSHRPVTLVSYKFTTSCNKLLFSGSFKYSKNGGYLEESKEIEFNKSNQDIISQAKTKKVKIPFRVIFTVKDTYGNINKETFKICKNGYIK